jgi:undecaprenyl diphosphate synthase
MLDADIQKMMADLEQETAHFTKITVCIALSYGARQEIVAAAKKLAQCVKDGDISIEDITMRLYEENSK